MNVTTVAIGSGDRFRTTHSATYTYCMNPRFSYYRASELALVGPAQNLATQRLQERSGLQADSPATHKYSDSQNCSNVSHFWKKSLITPSGKSLNIWKYLGG